MTRSQPPLPTDLLRHPELLPLLPLPIHLEVARQALIAAHVHLWNDPERPARGHDAEALDLAERLAHLADLIEHHVKCTLDDHHHVDF